MAIYYASPYGDDTNTGLTKHPTAAGGAGPWRTLKKALETGGLAAGDTVYVAPGDYGGTITVAYQGNADSDAGRIKIYGDPRNEQGLTTDGTTLIKPGQINIVSTANRTAAPTSNAALLSLSTKNNYTFKNLYFSSATDANGIIYHEGNNTNISYINCVFVSFNNYNIYTYNSNVALNWLFDSCIFWGASGVLCINTRTTSADVNLAITIKNSLIISLNTYAIMLYSAVAAYMAGGMTINNCTIIAPNAVFDCSTSTGASPTYPNTISNSYLAVVTYNTAISASNNNQIILSNNIITGGLVNTTLDKNSIQIGTTSIYPIFEMGQSQLWGLPARPFMTPLGLPGIGACNTNPGNLTTDILSRPRPAGGFTKPYIQASIGVQAGTGAYETGTVTTGSTATTLVVAGTPWTANSFIGKKVKLLTAPSSSPTLVGAVRWISSNTTNTLTVTPSWDYTATGTNFPLSGDTYEIYDAAKDIAVGCYELHDTGEQSTTYSADGTQASIKLTGPADHEFLIPVKKGKTYVFSIKGQFDSTYTFSSGTKPAATILANVKLGVAADSVSTMTGAADTWELLQFSPITPTRNGKLVMRLTNKSDTPTASCYFDSFSF
jgi:hypothetical protein